MRCGFITTSRADFGIYLPLIRAIEQEGWKYYVFAGGMHTSPKFGRTVDLIEKEHGIEVSEKIKSLVDDDSPSGIVQSMGATVTNFGSLWSRYKDEVDVVFVLGDRFEMFSAATSLLPYNIPIAHLHGGESTLGAIDDKFRHAITAFSDFHFASTEQHAARVAQIVGSAKKVYNVGALGIDGINLAELYSPDEFSKLFGFNVWEPYALVTYHPETVDLRNEEFVHELTGALKQLPYKVLCTLPNADTQGSVIRNQLMMFEKEEPSKIKCFENLGQRGYLSAMKYCQMMIGNTSSGIIEAASFNKPVINVGNRQKGRTAGENVLHVPNQTSAIVEAVKFAEKNLGGIQFSNPYGDGTAANKIIGILKKLF